MRIEVIRHIYDWDVDVFRAINIGWHSTYLDPMFWILTMLGNGEVQAVLILFGLLTATGKRLIWPLVASLTFGGIAGPQLIKHSIESLRPSNLVWAHPEELIYSNSFPSEHTTSSFALAVTLFLFLRRTRHAWVSYSALALSCLVGLSRIYRGVHWPTDVLGGICCGTFFGCLSYLTLNGYVKPEPT